MTGATTPPAHPGSRQTRSSGHGSTHLLWFYFVLASLQPVIQRQLLLVRRRAALSSVITLIQRQEIMALFGFPLVGYIGTFSRPAAPHANRLATP